MDLILREYFRTHKAIGSKDRRFIAESIYGMVRWKGLLDFLATDGSWEKRYQQYLKINPLDVQSDETIPHHVRVSFPKFYFQLIADIYGLKMACDLCLSSNTEAPTTIRVNTLKTSREELLEKWKNDHHVSACTQSSAGIVFHRKINFFALPEFKEGLFEVQDEGSQLIAQLIQAKPGHQVLDYCAGSGGKTLAFAPQMQKGGQIYLHDIRRRTLEEAKKRLKRAGIQNAQILNFTEPKKDFLKGKMHWVLVDAPCSGSGTLRRNPDMKWKFEPATLERLVLEQRDIFKEALEYLHPKGEIVYATCSLFSQENEEQVAFFQENFKVKLVKPPFKSFPTKGGMDGFFGAVFKF